jgi:PKD repeat protein
MVTSFTGVPTTGVVPLTVSFSGSATGTPDTWYWEFGDGGKSALQNPTHQYILPGTYNVNLKAMNAGSGIYDWLNQTGYVITSSVVNTNPVTTNATNFCIELNGVNNGGATNVWFEYGAGTAISNANAFKTPNQSAPGAYKTKICGIPLLPGKTYTYRAVGDVGGIITGGAEITFTMATVTPHPTTTYEQYANTFVDLSSDANGGDPVSKFQELLLVDIWAVYVEVIGFGLFFGVIIGMIFVNLVIKQQTIALSVIVMLLTGGSLFLILPPEFVQLAQILMIIAIAGMMYWVIKRKR